MPELMAAVRRAGLIQALAPTARTRYATSWPRVIRARDVVHAVRRAPGPAKRSVGVTCVCGSAEATWRGGGRLGRYCAAAGHTTGDGGGVQPEARWGDHGA